MAARSHRTHPAVGDDPLDRLPMGKQLTGTRAVAAWLKLGQLIDTDLRLIQAPHQQQDPGIQQNQPRRAAQQALRQLAAPTQDQRQILTLQHLLLGKTLKKTTRHIRLTGQQRMLHRCTNIALAGKPLTRMHMQRAIGHARGLPL